MSNFFKRQIELWGEDKQNNLKDKSIAIIGAGGLGNFLSLSLGGSGIGTIYIIDFDKVNFHNLHRQVAFTREDEGKYKAEVLKEMIENRCPFVKIIPINSGFDEFATMNIEVDLILDATDNLPIRKKINEYSKSKNIPWIYSSVEEFHGQVCFFDKSDFKIFNIQDRKAGGVAAPIIMQVAGLSANMCLRYLLGLDIKKDVLHYLSFDKSGNFDMKKFELPKD